MKAKASVQWFKHKTFWVAQLPGDGGVDWGYMPTSQDAIPLNVYWQRRFNADCRRLGRTAKFYPVAA